MQTYDEFWLFYLRSHANPMTRRIHYVAISVIIVGLIVAAARGSWLMVGLTIALGYLIAWSGHFTVENNRPVMFQHPLWSLRSGLQMYLLWISGRLEPELQRAGVSEPASRP